jgi:tRNA-2-methylthio-N6-dimethylallyladenosine synthase
MKQEVRSKKAHIRTYGCQMNVRDSEVISGLLKNAGYKLVDKPDEADVVIFNTCSVRQHAEEKVWSEVGGVTKSFLLDFAADSRKIKAGGTPRPIKKIIGLVGCMAQNYQDEIFRRAPAVDFVVGPSDIAKIPAIIHKLSAIRYPLNAKSLFENKIWETDGAGRPEEIYHTGFYNDKDHAYVVISEGCSNYCSYCVVPYVRGPLRKRSYRDILREIEETIDKGIKKITLLGQNVNAYREGEVGLVELVELVELVKGLEEFSFITSHPKDTSSELFKAMADCGKLKKYLHLPVQSGSDRILKLMNRGYTSGDYLRLVGEYRKIVEKGLLTTDIIVGFPGETGQEFRDTCDLIKEVEFDAGYFFK